MDTVHTKKLCKIGNAGRPHGRSKEVCFLNNLQDDGIIRLDQYIFVTLPSHFKILALRQGRLLSSSVTSTSGRFIRKGSFFSFTNGCFHKGVSKFQNLFLREMPAISGFQHFVLGNHSSAILMSNIGFSLKILFSFGSLIRAFRNEKYW